MSIRKKKAEAIIGGLMVDLAASGAFDALAIVKQARSGDGDQALLAADLIKLEKRAWTIESPATNLRDALKNIEFALKRVNLLINKMPTYAASGEIKDSAAWSRELGTLRKKLSSLEAALKKALDSIGTNTDRYWKDIAPPFLRERRKEIYSIIDGVKKNKIIAPDSPFAQVLTEHLVDAVDEIENTLDALDEPIEGPSASQSDAAPAPAATSPEGVATDEPSQAYDKYILGGKKALEEFFKKYPVEQDPKERDSFNKEAYDIVKTNIIDNKEVQALMRHTDISPSAKEKLIRSLKFSAAAERTHNAVIAQIEKASAELDNISPTLPGG